MSHAPDGSILIQCTCKSRVRLSPQKWQQTAGTLVRCPKCGNSLQVPPLPVEPETQNWSYDFEDIADEAYSAPQPGQAQSGASVDQWFYTVCGIQAGPVSSDNLRHLAAIGQISPRDWVWKQGVADWVPASQVTGLFPSASFGPPPLPAFRRVPTVGFHPQRITIAIAAGAGMVATFLPWVYVPIIGAIPGNMGDGWITFVLFIAPLVLALVGAIQSPITGAPRVFAAIPAGLAAVIGVSKIFHISFLPPNERLPGIATDFRVPVNFGIGLFLVIAAGVGIVVILWGKWFAERS